VQKKVDANCAKWSISIGKIGKIVGLWAILQYINHRP
jgi:hypothetical protein